jgi:hypothetical protein
MISILISGSVPIKKNITENKPTISNLKNLYSEGMLPIISHYAYMLYHIADDIVNVKLVNVVLLLRLFLLHVCCGVHCKHYCSDIYGWVNGSVMPTSSLPNVLMWFSSSARISSSNRLVV